MRILLIDDDQDLCQLTKKVLEMNGYTVDAFFEAASGVKYARQNRPNLILMDIILPGLTGPEIIASLKTDQQFINIPVVFLSALVSGDDVESEGIMVGGLKYQTIGKPYEIDKLLAIVKKYAK